MWCKNFARQGAAAMGLAVGLAFIPAAQAQPAAPYQVDVWADVLFGTDGRAEKVEIPATEGQPAAFIERLKKQLMGAKIQPRTTADGQPATWQTGMQVVVQITPSEQGAQAKLLGISPGPRPLKSYAAPWPKDGPANEQSEVVARCTVKADGLCTGTVVVSTTGTSEGLRRWATASMDGWRFEPQRLNGQPVETEVTKTLVLINQTEDLPKDFRDGRRLTGR